VDNNTNRNVRDELRYNDNELLYDNNSIIILYESIELLEILRNQFKYQNPKNVERRNGMLICDLIIKYCMYSETLGATINGFEQSNKLIKPSSTIVLRHLRDFEVSEVSKFYQRITSMDYKHLAEDVRSKLVYAFGYKEFERTRVEKTILNIFHLLKEIAGVYLFYVKSYNAYKHGHRVWYGFNLNTQRTNSLLYIEREYKPKNYEMNFVPLDDEIVTDFIFPRSNDCRRLFELLLYNNKNLSNGKNNHRFLDQYRVT
jgi:hypothetical protein